MVVVCWLTVAVVAVMWDGKWMEIEEFLKVEGKGKDWYVPFSCVCASFSDIFRH